MPANRYSLAYHHNNMVPAPAGEATVRIIWETEDGIMSAYGTTVPTDATAGYAIGCDFWHTDGSGSTAKYVNVGTSGSCLFQKTVTDEMAPVRASSTGYAYGINVDGDGFFTGGAASKSYLMQLAGDREAGNAATGDSNDALLKLSGSNYAANDANFILRGLNCAMSNRSGGVLGHMYGGNISISLKSGSGNISNAIALALDAQDLTAGTKAEFGGLDVAINREGTAATTEYGMQLRTRGTINTAINTAIRISKDATDHGFVNLFNIETDAVDFVACTGDVTVTNADKAIPIVLNGTTYYLIAVDGIPGA